MDEFRQADAGLDTPVFSATLAASFAEDVLLPCFRAAPRAPGRHRELQETLARARGHRLLGHPRHAERLLDGAVAAHPRSAAVHIERAWLHADRGRIVEGIAAADRALELVPADQPDLEVGALFARGVLAARSGDVERATLCAERMIGCRPGRATAMREAALVFESAGWNERALATAEQACDLATGDQVGDLASCLVDFARLLRTAGEIEEAEEVLQRVDDLGETSAATLVGWADLRHAQGRHEESLGLADLARGAQGSDACQAEISRVRARALARLGAVAEARAEIERCLALDPDNLPALELNDDLPETGTAGRSAASA